LLHDLKLRRDAGAEARVGVDEAEEATRGLEITGRAQGAQVSEARGLVADGGAVGDEARERADAREKPALRELDATADVEDGVEYRDRPVETVAHELNVRVDRGRGSKASPDADVVSGGVLGDGQGRDSALNELVDPLVKIHAHLAPTHDCTGEAVARAVRSSHRGEVAAGLVERHHVVCVLDVDCREEAAADELLHESEEVLRERADVVTDRHRVEPREVDDEAPLVGRVASAQ
jgi:hypothetical protein